jgi:hypothetical protein
MIQIELHKVPNKRIVALIILTFAIVLAPYWFLFQYNKSLFFKTDLIPLLLICISIGLPVALFNLLMLTVIILEKEGPENESVWFNRLIITAVCTIFIFYAPSVILYLQAVNKTGSSYAERGNRNISSYSMVFYNCIHICDDSFFV